MLLFFFSFILLTILSMSNFVLFFYFTSVLPRFYLLLSFHYLSFTSYNPSFVSSPSYFLCSVLPFFYFYYLYPVLHFFNVLQLFLIFYYHFASWFSLLFGLSKTFHFSSYILPFYYFLLSFYCSPILLSNSLLLFYTFLLFLAILFYSTFFPLLTILVLSLHSSTILYILPEQHKCPSLLYLRVRTAITFG